MSKKPQEADLLDNYLQDSKNWKWYYVYRCHLDPRIVVPVRNKGMGFAFNFAHRSAFLLITVIILAAIVPTYVVVRDSQPENLPLAVGFSIIFIAVLLFTMSRIGRQ